MKIGILETGLVNEKLSDRFDPYPIMFASLLNRAEQNFEYQAYSVVQSEMPESIHDCDGWLITGSRHAVYEKLDWILELEDFIREIHDASVPLVGICFGHQIIAQVMGGRVVKSGKGWSVGVESFEIDKPQDWMTRVPKQVSLYSFYQDQVTELPPTASVFSSSEFCPYAGLSYGDSIISVQAHPEIEEPYELALLEIYGGNKIPQAVATEALGKMRASNCQVDTQLLANWIANFFVSRKK